MCNKEIVVTLQTGLVVVHSGFTDNAECLKLATQLRLVPWFHVRIRRERIEKRKT